MYRARFLRIATTAVALAWLFGCAADQPHIDWSQQIAPLPTDLAAEVPQTTPRDTAVHKAIAAVVDGDYPQASRWINLALKLDSTNSNLHFLNGLIYQLMVAKGDTNKAPLAETAYLLALRLDPSNYLASYQLGRLYLDQQDYARAENYLADAAAGRHANVDTYDALAVAAYYNRDLTVAVWAISHAKRLAPDDPAVLRTAALIETVAGRDDEAAQDSRLYAGSHPIRLAAFEQRLAELRANRDDAGQQLAQSSDPFPPETRIIHTPPPAPASAAGGSGSVKSWYDCNGAPPPAAPASTGYSSDGSSPQGDEPVALPALPPPCEGATMPKMALIDVVIIRTEENESTSYGVNLLDGLQVVLNGSISHSQTRGTTPNVARTTAYSLALGNTTATGIAYTLNMANAADSTDQIIARPTLLALDREPSQFFSGANLSIALTGQYGGNVVEKPIGVSLSVTPTFVDDDTVLLAVKAARSFFESQVTISGTIGQSIETSRNMAVANVVMKFGQTLILSGLNEKENTTASDGVPLLRDIPGFQYFFSNRTTSNYSKSVIILMTPRRPAYGDQLPSPLDRLAIRPSLEELRDRASVGLGPTSNLEVIAHSLDVNPHYLAYRSGDVNAEYWIEPRSLSRTLHESLSLLYF